MKINNLEKTYLAEIISDLMDIVEDINPQSDLLLRADKALQILDRELDDISYLVFVAGKTDKEAEEIINNPVLVKQYLQN